MNPQTANQTVQNFGTILRSNVYAYQAPQRKYSRTCHIIRHFFVWICLAQLLDALYWLTAWLPELCEICYLLLIITWAKSCLPIEAYIEV
jgi:hypothetical protein